MKKQTKRLTSSQAEFLGFKAKPREKSDNTKARYQLDKKQLKKLRRYDDMDSNGKVMVYDIETSQVTVKLWSTGKQYVNHSALVDGPEGHTRIISIAWKYVGEDKVHALTWDDGCDKEMMQEFMAYYNRCDMVIGQNNNSFDNKLVATRAAYHGLFLNRFVKSFDIYRKVKQVFRLQSYSMAHMAKFFGLTLKQSHEGIFMWKMIQEGTDAQKAEYLQKMVDYNVGDIVTTEEMYMKLRPYLSTVTHAGVATGEPRWTCPVTGSRNIELYNTLITEAGSVQRVLYCPDSNHQFKVSNAIYREFLEYQG